MSLIQTMAPDKATGSVKDGYKIFNARGVDIPHPLRLMSASPEYFRLMMLRNQYYMNHPHLSFPLLAHIRYFASKRLGYTFCQVFNKEQLIKQGVTAADFEIMGDDPDKSLLEDTEKQMLSFVLRAMDDPESISSEDIEILRDAGWQDSDIFDALAQGVGMTDHSIFMRVFKPDF